MKIGDLDRVEAINRNRGSDHPIDIPHPDLSGADLSGAEIRGFDLSGVNFSGADLRGADLSFTNLDGANLTDADLRNANLCRANLSRSNLTRTKLFGADLTGARRAMANIGDAIFTADPGIPQDPQDDYVVILPRSAIVIAPAYSTIPSQLVVADHRPAPPYEAVRLGSSNRDVKVHHTKHGLKVVLPRTWRDTDATLIGVLAAGRDVASTPRQQVYDAVGGRLAVSVWWDGPKGPVLVADQVGNRDGAKEALESGRFPWAPGAPAAGPSLPSH